MLRSTLTNAVRGRTLAAMVCVNRRLAFVCSVSGASLLAAVSVLAAVSLLAAVSCTNDEKGPAASSDDAGASDPSASMGEDIEPPSNDEPSNGGDDDDDPPSSTPVPNSGGAGETSGAMGGNGNTPQPGPTGDAPTPQGGSPQMTPDPGPVTVCGDGTCQVSESCGGCAVDCGECGVPPTTECNDGVDNDGDGLLDWAYDVGCVNELDTSEAGGAVDADSGFTTFDLSDDSLIVYVSSSDGDDANDGLTPDTAVATPARGAELVRDGSPDFLLFKRGDTWRAMDLGSDRIARRFKSGRDAEHPLVVYSYGTSTERPRFELDKHFIDDDGNERNYLAIMGLAFVSYPKIPDDPEFDGAAGGALRFVGTGHDILIEDNYAEYGEYTIQNVTNVTFRRNVVWRAYELGTCAYNADGSRDPNGNSDLRPSGIFAGGVDGLTIEANVFDENGWNPDVAEACATIYNHDLYLSGNQRLTVRDNLILRASSIGIKVSSAEAAGSADIMIENNLFAEGEIGISMGGNADTAYRFTDATVRDNIFTDIGRSKPTGRNLTWYIEILDNDRTLISGNLLVNQPSLGNEFGIRLGNMTNRDVSISDNLFHGLARRALWFAGTDPWDNITVGDNAFIGTGEQDCMISHSGTFATTTYQGNLYDGAGALDAWFCVGNERLDLTGWLSASGDLLPNVALDAPEPTRNLDSYASALGIGSTLADFAAHARTQSRHAYRPELDARNANNYIREGYGRPLR